MVPMVKTYQELGCAAGSVASDVLVSTLDFASSRVKKDLEDRELPRGPKFTLQPQGSRLNVPALEMGLNIPELPGRNMASGT
jgi:hypothetical protein